MLEEVKGRRRFTWILLSQNAQVADVRDGVLVLAMAGIGPRDSFAKGGSENILRDALNEALGVDLRIETIVDPSVSAGGRGGGSGSGNTAGGRRGAPAQPEPSPPPSGVAFDRSGDGPGGPGGQAPAVPPGAGVAPGAFGSELTGAGLAGRGEAGSISREQARQGIRPTRQGGAAVSPEAEDLRDEAASVDDTDLEELEESHTELLARQLGAEIIGEEPHEV